MLVVRSLTHVRCEFGVPGDACLCSDLVLAAFVELVLLNSPWLG